MAQTTREINLSRLPKIDFDFAGFSKWYRLDKPLAVEIGCGVGLHPITWAKENPNAQIFAVERTSEKFQKFARRLKNHPELDNIWAAHGEAAVLLPQILAPNSVGAFFYMYPNPEPQAANRRLGQSPLLKFLFSALKSGGRLQVATNVEAYARELFVKAPSFGFIDVKMTMVAPNSKPRTHFEKKYLARHECCWDVVLSKQISF